MHPGPFPVSVFHSGSHDRPPLTAFAPQVFYITSGQAGAFELALALPSQAGPAFDAGTAGRFLLSPGDHFYIPPNNVYRLENHSETHTVRLFFGIVKPMSTQ